MTDQRSPNKSIDLLCINTIRTLAIDAIQQAESGHPGAPMALAPAAYTLWTRIMNYNPLNPGWFNRDRFVLSNGHASMLLYAMLYLCGYGLSLNDLKSFRQWGSKTPGHPEYKITPGVETTTGPLGQGLMNAVGMAMAEAHLAAVYNRPGHHIVDHFTYVFCGDGDFMEGASHEAASLAGHFGLGKLICLYDDNHISIEGATELTCSDDVQKRFEAYQWHVQNIADNANDIDVLSQAFNNAQADREHPSLIIVRTHIGFGSPNLQDNAEAHGAPLGEQEILLTKRNYGWPEKPAFLVPDEVLTHMRQSVERGRLLESAWQDSYAHYQRAYPKLAENFELARMGKLCDGWDNNLPLFLSKDGALATRSASGKVINSLAKKVPWLVGGSADLAPSNNSLITGTGYFEKGQYEHRNIPWGVREHAMCACASGMALHGGIRPFVATFFVFSDYARPAIRLAALMDIPVIYVMTHDSIGLGEDGPTHQPVEQLASLRAMPNICIIRPADANETVYAWRAALLRTSGPTLLVFTRQKLPIFDRAVYGDAAGVLKGAYTFSKEAGSSLDMILIASGSELEIALAAQIKLLDDGIHARVVSMPSWELFRKQPQNYQDEILPPHIKARIAIEAGSPMGWCEWLGFSGAIIGINTFGASAPYKELFKQYGITADKVIAQAKLMLGY